ncbi:MAG: hypothetical protein U0470_14105 [Anaerolineae bacterium]
MTIGGVPFGGPGFGVIAGPCAVESADAILQAARACMANGAVVLRGGAFAALEPVPLPGPRHDRPRVATRR